MLRHTRRVIDLVLQFAPKGTGAEIGVKQGFSSYGLLDASEVKIYMVDPWKANFSTLHSFYLKQEDCDRDYQEVVERNKKYKERVCIVKKYSVDAAKTVPSNLDFVFIDANHEYDYVMTDLCSWVPKVKSGGLVMGHDWSMDFPEVVTAIRDFCRENPNTFLPPFDENDYKNFNLEFRYLPAPSLEPCINKSAKAKVWWVIKK